MLERLKELLEDTLLDWECDVSKETVSEIAEHLIENGVIVTPCVVYNKKHERYQIVKVGKQLHRFSSKFYRNRGEAEKAFKGGASDG